MTFSWVRRFGSSGALGFGALATAVISGIALALAYDALHPYDSIAVLLLTNTGGRFFRNVHYWSAQLLLIFLVVHAWRHVARSSERKLRLAVWTRIVILLPLAAFLMLSGFILKGDAEGLQALRILTASIEQIPVVGRLLSIAFFGGVRDSLQVVYVHHVATATLLTWLLVSEHARAIWPRLPSFVAIGAVSMLVALVAAPSLHDGLNPIIKGPWYFVGLQEIFHHATRPDAVFAAIALTFAAVVALPGFPALVAPRLKVGLALLALAYGAVTLVALFSRGPNWSLQAPTLAAASGVRLESPLRVPPLSELRGKTMPVALGRREGCLFCHARTTGLSRSHQPDAVGCSSCHAGNPFSLDKDLAHRGIVLIPGNLDTAARTCGTTACHPAIVERVDRSIMTTMRGVIAVDRETFGEVHKGSVPRPAALGDSAADTHLRQLCVSCHLGARKQALGPIDEASRGGGCNACHLVYSRTATDWLTAYTRDQRSLSASAARMVHPDLSIRISDDHCFGCHSRSGRVSTSYEGWHEQSPGVTSSAGRPTRTLRDERVFVREQPDIHFQKGMLCVDCHTAREVMGNGVEHARKGGQATVACDDCHSTRLSVTLHERADEESKRILSVLGRFQPGRSALITRQSGEVLTSTTIAEGGRPVLVSKRDHIELPLKPPAVGCVAAGAHARLSCTACHTAWSPRCSSCHTSFEAAATAIDHVRDREVRGSWMESGSDFEAQPPTLGVRIASDAHEQRRTVIEPFVPGMVLTIRPPASTGGGALTIFRRLYARTFSHTVSARGRSCVSCHNDPIAIGYGRGALTYVRTREGGRWTFSPANAASAFDGLPNDAWIGFLEHSDGSRSTRQDVRPFDIDEQKRILTVGACLTCHAADSHVIRRSLIDFAAVVRRATPRCVVPTWTGR